MKKTALYYLAITALVLSAVFTSCNSKGSDNVKLLESMTMDGYTVKFEYDERNRVVKMLHYYDGERVQTQTLTYSGNDLVALEHDVEDWSNMYFERNGNTIITADMNIAYTITVNNDGHIIKLETESDMPHREVSAYKYHDGNLIESTMEVIKGYNKGEKWVKKYQYDDKKSPFFHSNTPKWFMHLNYMFFNLFSTNNVVEIKDNWGTITTYEYKYDRDGYPIKQTKTRTGEHGTSKTITTFKYRNVTKSKPTETIAENNVNLEEEEQEEQEEVETVKLLERIIYGDGELSAFTILAYDDQNRIVSIKYYDGGGDLRYTTTLTYSGENLIKSKTVYDEGLVVEMNFTRRRNTIQAKDLNFSYSITVSNDGYITKQDLINGDKDHTETFHYKDGNLIKLVQELLIAGNVVDVADIADVVGIAEEDLKKITEYKHDTKHSQFNCNTPKWFLQHFFGHSSGSKNNVVSWRRGHTEGVFSTSAKYQYEYDSDGFPTKQFFSDGHEETTTIFIYTK